MIEYFGDVAVQMQGIGPDQAAVAPHFPGIPRQPAGEPLAMGGPAEHEQLAGHGPAAARHIERGRPAQPRAVEQDGFLRQPFHPGAVPDRQTGGDMNVGTVGAIDLFGRLGGDHGGGIGADGQPRYRAGRRRPDRRRS